MTYLGLGPDDEYDEYDDVEPVVERAPRPAPSRAPMRRPMAEPDMGDVALVGTVRRLEPQPVEPQPGIGAITAAGPRRGTPVVRAMPVASNAKPHVVSPTSFNEAQEVADRFKGLVPVIINMQSIDRDLARRLIDFASGLCYGLGGSMDKVANQVYLLTPSNVEVSPEERRRLQERGLYD
jgi:cell division inhibitor SepF